MQKLYLLYSPVFTSVYFQVIFAFNLHLIIYLITVFSSWHLSMFLALERSEFISGIHISAKILSNPLGMNQMLEVETNYCSTSPNFLLKSRTYFRIAFSLILLNIFQNVIQGLSYSIVTEGTPVNF